VSKRLDVLKAVKALAAAALPGATVLGLDNKAGKPQRVPANGLVVVREGSPGQPAIDLSPLTYNYDHSIPLEVAAYESSSRTPSEALDDMLVAIGAAIAADRTLGGLCDWLDAEAPNVEEFTGEGTAMGAEASLIITAAYNTPNPLD
jgi:hypothetical protein